MENERVLTQDEIKSVKGRGFLNQKGTDKFNARVVTVNGKITSEQCRALADAADEFGSGEVAFTTRLSAEVQGIPFDKIDAFCESIGKVGLEAGGTGPKVRPIVSCKGTTCQYGLCDTYALSEKVHKIFYKGYGSVKLPHKFKIAVGGCPNNCVKPNLNDVGISGRRIPQFNADKCRGCKVCAVEKACPVHVPHEENGKLVIPEESCNKCGRCVGKCPFGSIEDGVYGYAVIIGGRWGKRVAQGRQLTKIFTSEQEVLEVVEKALLFFKDQGKDGERFNDTINRLGFEYVEEQLMGDDLLKRKEEIIAAELKK